MHSSFRIRAALSLILAGTILFTSYACKPPTTTLHTTPTTTTTVYTTPTTTLTTSTTPTPLPGLENILTDQQVVADLVGADQYQEITPEWISKIIAVDGTCYNKLTDGNTTENAKIVPKLMTHDEYVASKDTIPDSVGCVSFGKNGETYLLVDIGQSVNGIITNKPLYILYIMARERGQAETDVVVPSPGQLGIKSRYDLSNEVSQKVAKKDGNGDISNIIANLGGINTEIGEWAYASAESHLLEELGAIKHTTINQAQKEDIDEVVDNMVNSINEGNMYSEFTNASLTVWYLALTNPVTLATLQKTNKITYQQ